MLRKFGIIAVLSLLVTAVAAVPALAQNPHFLPNRGPTAVDEGLTLNATGTLFGLGNEGGTIQLVAQGAIQVACVNPSGQQEPPGQQPAPTTLTSPVVQINPEDVTRSGQFQFDLDTTAPTLAQVPAGTCKTTPGWTTRITDVVFTSYSIVVVDAQSGETTTLGPFTNITPTPTL
jgi:hypothetical protein